MHVMNERAALLAPELSTGPSSWPWLGDAYASGKVHDVRVEVSKLGLTPLPLSGGELEDVAERSEPYRRTDPYFRLWKKLTATPRHAYEFDAIAWGALPGADPDDNPTCNAAELREAGRIDQARKLLMETLGVELRVLDAHAHLGNMAFDTFPRRALVHYEVGVRIGDLSLPTDFDGPLPWSRLYNRAFLRCLNGYGLALWRLGRLADAEKIFERLLSLNPADHQGVRFCWFDVGAGRSWEQATAEEEVSDAAPGLH